MALVLGGHDPPLMESRRWASVATLGLLFAAACALPAPSWAAQNGLVSPSVSPRTGTPATTFVFSVTYDGRDPASSVVAIVAGQTVSLALVSGTTTSGAYSGASQLAAGTWTVTFSADASRGNDPTAGGGTVQVNAPTPIPTPVPTPVPTPPPVVVIPAPTPPPAGGATAPPQSSPTPLPAPIDGQQPPAGATSSASSAGPLPSSQDAVTGPAGGGVFSAAPSPVAAGAGSVGVIPSSTDWLWPILVGGVGLIAMVAAWGLIVAARDRRRRQAEQAALAAATPGLVPSADPEQPRAAAVWELDAQLEEEKIGTVDFLPLGKEEAGEEAPAVLTTAPPPKRVSPRVARLEAARSRRPASTRRRLLEGD